MSTIEIYCTTKLIEVEGNLTELQIWDRIGQRKFNSMVIIHFKHEDGVFVIFDVTNRDIFNLTRYWIKSIQEIKQ